MPKCMQKYGTMLWKQKYNRERNLAIYENQRNYQCSIHKLETEHVDWNLYITKLKWNLDAVLKNSCF